MRVRAKYPSGLTVRRVREFRGQLAAAARRHLRHRPGSRHHGVVAQGAHGGTNAVGQEEAHPRGRIGSLSYRWRILAAPDDSNARLKNAGSRRPRFVPDTAGIYRLEVTVSDGGSGAAGPVRRDVTQIEAQSPEATRAGVFIGTEPLDADGNPTALRIFGGDDAGSFPLGSQNGKPGPVVTLVIDRCTLDVVDTVYTRADTDGGNTINTLLGVFSSYAEQHGGCNVMFVTAGADYGQRRTTFSAM